MYWEFHGLIRFYIKYIYIKHTSVYIKYIFLRTQFTMYDGFNMHLCALIRKVT